MGDDLSRLPFAIALSRQSKRVIRQNLFVSLGVIVALVIVTVTGADIAGRERGHMRGGLRGQIRVDDLDQTKAFAPDHHRGIEAAIFTKEGLMRGAPEFQTAIAFAFLKRKGRVDFIEALLFDEFLRTVSAAKRTR